MVKIYKHANSWIWKQQKYLIGERIILHFYRFTDSSNTPLLYYSAVCFTLLLHSMGGLWRHYFSFINFLLHYKLQGNCLWSLSREEHISEVLFNNIKQEDKYYQYPYQLKPLGLKLHWKQAFGHEDNQYLNKPQSQDTIPFWATDIS